ncbi:MAG TPA: peptidoglycan-binding domain-containing protein [Chthoniobacterales bacterium]
MKRSCLAFLFLFFAGAGLLRADQATLAVQQALKDQGFYYGAVNGQKTSDTTAAIRRYQIRNGLQITGEIDAETLRSLGVSSGGQRPAARPAPTVSHAQSEPEEEGAPQSAEISPPEPPSNYGPPPAAGIEPRGYRMERREVFAGTPYEIAPPDLQRHVVVGAQALLARYGYYRSGIDGEFGSATVGALRAFQARAGLVPDGRLNMETLGALGLLPGQRGPGFRGSPRRLPPRPVYRGEPVIGR